MMRAVLFMVASSTLAVLLVSGTVLANTFTVKNEKDSGRGSLRAAIEAANKQPGGDVITFAPSARDAIDLKSALPRLRGTLEIRGPGAGELTVRRSFASATPGFCVFTVARNSTVTISGLKISHGRVSYSGSGIYSPPSGALTLRGLVVTGNTTPRGLGGGVYSEGRLRVVDSTFSANVSGGLINRGDHASVLNSTFSANEGSLTNFGDDMSILNSTFSANQYGGLTNYGDRASVVSSTFVNNNNGEGIWNGGTLTVRDSTFSENSAGGIYNYKSRDDPTKLTVIGSTFSENGTTDCCIHGGGISNGDIASVSNSTFSGNTADTGGGIYNSGTLTLTSSTLFGNIATGEMFSVGSGGGLYNANSSMDSFSLRTTIVANNEAPSGPDAFGTFSSGGYNLIGDTAGASGFGPTDMQNADASLDPQGLQDNGGPTNTIALLDTSPAIDGVEVGCPPPATDQRGVSRPQDGDGDTVARCDIGAYELQVP